MERGGSEVSSAHRGQQGRRDVRTGVTEGLLTASLLHPSSQILMQMRLAGNSYQFTVVVGRPRSPGRVVQARHGSRSICGFFTGHRGQCTRSRKKTRRNARFSSGVICCRSSRHSEFRSLLIGYHPLFLPWGTTNQLYRKAFTDQAAYKSFRPLDPVRNTAAAEAYH